jgi:alkylation response protein AidB-like acyl-CoA dehydrogenase
VSVTREQVVRRARELAPELRDRALKAEELRRVPAETFQAFKDAGLLRVFVPKRFGGYELELATVIETTREIGEVCGSSSWCLAICTLHNWMVTGFPEAAQQEVFGPGPDSVVCGVFMPGGKATPVDGGYRLSGQWDFASGCDHASHAVLAGLVCPDADGPPQGMSTFLVRREDFRIDDNWFVAGLAGTGSKRVVVDDVFVPTDWANGIGPGMQPSVAGSRTAEPAPRRLPTNSVATLGLAGVPLGVARAALLSFQERLATKVRAATFRTPQQQVGPQQRLAESAVELDAVQLMVLRDCEEMHETAARGVPASAEQRGRYRRDAAWAFQTCARAVARLLPAAGAHAIYNDGLLQRALRDTQVMATHMVADWDMSRETYARARLGLDVEDPVF